MRLHEIADSADFADFMIEATTLAGVGFHFEEGGCWGMALALRDEFARRGRTPSLAVSFLRGEPSHAMVLLDGHLYDHQGKVAMPMPVTKVDEKGLFDAAARAGLDKSEVMADKDLADEIIQNAVHLSRTS